MTPRPREVRNAVIGVLAVAVALLAWLAYSSRSWIGSAPLAGESSFSESHMMDEIAKLMAGRERERGGGLAARVEFPEDFRDFGYVRSVVLAPGNHYYGGFHIVLANQAALNSPKGRFDEGSVIVKLQSPVVRDEIDNLFPSDLQSVFVMEKDSKRYPAGTEGWGFEIFDLYAGMRFATTPEVQRWCFACHKARAGPDRVFSPLKKGVRALRVPEFRDFDPGEAGRAAFRRARERKASRLP